MATHWLREIMTSNTGDNTGFPFMSKALAIFLRYGMSFTSNNSEVDSIGIGDSVSAPDPAVGPDQNKQTFTDAEGRFTVNDVGKNFHVGDVDPFPVDANNNGTFVITDFVSATQIKYLNASGSAETYQVDWWIDVTDESFWSYEKSGTNGSINVTGTDKNFQDTTAALFTGADTGKWLMLVDSTNPRNSGWYKMTFVDASNVTLDFRSGAAEYPTQNTGANLTWYTMADSYQVPTRRDTWWRLETPHANGWAIELWYSDMDSDQQFQIRVAVDGNWTGSKFLSTVYTGLDDSEVPWFYCAVDDGGEFINFFYHNNSNSAYCGFVAANLILPEPDRLPAEQVVLMGNRGSGALDYAVDNYVRDNADDKLGRGDIWSERVQAVRPIYMLEASQIGEAIGFSGWVSRTANVRNSSQWDVLEGVPVVVDPSTGAYPQNEFEIAGRVKGVFLTSGAASERTAQDDEGTLDKFHIQDGLAIEWPGVTEQH